MSRDDRLRLAFAALHPDRVRGLVDRFGSAGAVVRALERGSLEAPDAAREAVRVPAVDRRDGLAMADISVAYRGADDYPAALAMLPDAPDLLFVRGCLPAEPGVAVVGARRATSYGIDLAFRYGAALADEGRVVVSGLARGVDGAAHRGALSAKGSTVAVLGCGPDRWYPASHARLGAEILASGGGVVSEYPPGAAPLAWRFPPRNRIISGMSAAVVVVEATVKGGALITANTGLAQGREIFALPGDIDRTTSEGCNRLIRDGAHSVFDPDDLLESLSIVMGPAKRPSPVATASLNLGR